jgi:hypothetical protein
MRNLMPGGLVLRSVVMSERCSRCDMGAPGPAGATRAIAERTPTCSVITCASGTNVMRTVEQLQRWIRRLGPYPSLALLAVPLATVEPLKLLAVMILGSAHWFTGSLVIAGAYLLSLLVVERLFRLVKPKLLRLAWFAAAWRSLLIVRRKVFAWAEK